jgi:hypothetical protein
VLFRDGFFTPEVLRADLEGRFTVRVETPRRMLDISGAPTRLSELILGRQSGRMLGPQLLDPI